MASTRLLQQKRTVNLLVVSNMYPDNKHPFYGIFVKNTVEKLKETARFKVKVVTKHKSRRKIKRFTDYLSFYLSVINNIIRHKYDIIYLHYLTLSFPPVFLGKLIINTTKKSNKVKIIAHIHGSDLRTDSTINKFLLATMKPFMKTIDGWIVPSKQYHSILEDFLGKKKIPILIYPSGGVDTKLFRPMKKEEAKRRLNLNSTDFVVGWVSRIDRNKGWEIFLKALHKASKSIPNVKAIVAGSGRDEPLFIKAIHDLGIENKVIILGSVKHEQLPLVYNAMDVFVFPTMKESLGLVGLEALACGIPVIASNTEGPKEYVKENVNGFLFERGSAKSLYEKIMKFYNLSDKAKEEMKRKALKVAKEYDSHRVNKELTKFLLEVHNENNRNS